jgi:hypothetical protein
MFNLINAFSLAFGCNLVCYGREDIHTLKRPRIAAELNNEGFSGEFAYGMFGLPAGGADRFGLPWSSRTDDVEDDPTSSKASGCKSKATSFKAISPNHTPARANRPKIPRVPNDESGDAMRLTHSPKGKYTLESF